MAVSILRRAVTEESEEHRRQERLKLYFECFKHLTTLNTGAALVVLALYRGIAITDLSLLAILAFGISLITSLYGAIRIPQRGFLESNATYTSLLLTAASVTFFSGILLAFVTVVMAYGARRPVFFWIGVLLALYGVGLALYPHLKRGWQLFSQWRSR